MNRTGLLYSVMRRLPARHILKQIADGWQARVLLTIMMVRTRDLALFRDGIAVRSLSRSHLGWVTNHRTRLWEYPWVLQQVNLRSQGRRRTAADIGAGTSPIPIALSRMGLQTLVADPADQAVASGREEWSWTDYTRFGIHTSNSGMESLDIESMSIGVLVCVSVIEHVPAAIRRAGLAEFARALEPGGVCVITIDLVPDTDQLWNRADGKRVESDAEHGSLADLIAEASLQGLTLETLEPCPLQGYMPQVDTLGLVFRKSQTSADSTEHAKKVAGDSS